MITSFSSKTIDAWRTANLALSEKAIWLSSLGICTDHKITSSLGYFILILHLQRYTKRIAVKYQRPLKFDNIFFFKFSCSRILERHTPLILAAALHAT
jgi:hypothetical protein